MDLAGWLDYQQRVHPRAIELGLDRVRAVWQRLGSPRPAPVVITVGGTNGKGSTVAFLEAMLRADGKRVGAYTSPHLLRYNERVRIDGVDAGDDALVAAFERIEAARGDVALTYFEYGTLAALLLFAEAKLDVALLEVGLGGRLDAVNIIDADAAIVTTIDIDHQDWLGNDRDSIGREKAGIFRAGRPAIIGDGKAPRGLLEAAERIGADVRIAGRDFSLRFVDFWVWRSGDAIVGLPEPELEAPCQIYNAAAAIAALHALRDRLGWNFDAIRRGVADARVGARLQRFAGKPELIVDVAHNPQAARVLAEWLASHETQGRTIAVFGALDDKDVHGIVEPLAEAIDVWHLAGLANDSPRGLTSTALGDRVEGVEVAGMHDDVSSALAAASEGAGTDDRVIAFGSFFVAAAALTFAGSQCR
ncbi:MAG TPA: bifunctional tetrahydrofolate synthase/dihydrofolate synthase [Rhodanobacteraceae bacterium]|nr:bifunctional tetrahydrofolate synthase/dihydrofolate synthase [Rhodanobacteraceae bacterium]